MFTRNRGTAVSADFWAFSEWWYSDLNPVPSPLLAHKTRFTTYLPSSHVGTSFESHCVWLDGPFGEKKNSKKSTVNDKGLRELAMDSNSYIEPEDDDFLLDSDDFVAEIESSNGDM